MATVMTQPVPTSGVNTDEDSTRFTRPQAPYMKNMWASKTLVQKRKGYQLVGSSSLPLSGTPMEAIVYIDARGTRHEIILTTTHAYHYDINNDEWDDITPQSVLDNGSSNWTAGAGCVTASSVATGSLPAGYPSGAAILLDCAADVADGGLLGYIALSGATDLTQYTQVKLWVHPVTTALSANSLEIVVTENADGTKGGTEVISATHAACPADTWTQITFTVNLSSIDGAQSIAIYANHETELDGLDVYIDEFTVRMPFTGTTSNKWTFAVVTDTNEFSNNGGSALVICNGVNAIQYFEGHTSDVFKELEHGSTVAYCKCVVEFFNHMFLGSYYASSVWSMKSMIHMAPGDIDDSTGDAAGSYFLSDSVGALLRLQKLGLSLVAYSEYSMTLGSYYGSLTTFTFPTVISDLGLLSVNAIAGFKNSHVFLGSDRRVYQYFGGTDLIPIGDAIESSLFSKVGSYNKDSVTTGIDTVRYKLHFFVPISRTKGLGGARKSSYTYNYRDSMRCWEYHEYAHDIVSAASLQPRFAWYMDEAPLATTYMDELASYMDSLSGVYESELTLLISSDGYVFTVYPVWLDNASTISCEVQTPDFLVNEEENKGTWQWFSFQAKSEYPDSTVRVRYSTDGGENWTTFADSPVSLEDSWTTHRLPLTAVSRKIRFKIEQLTTGDLQLRGLYKAMVQPSSERD